MPHVSTDQIAIWPSLTIPAAHSVDSLTHTPARHRQSSIHLFGLSYQQGVLSDECELVSARTMKPPVMPHRVDATQQERRFG